MRDSERTEKRLQLAENLLQVSENPFEYRVIVMTQIPDLNMPWEEDGRLFYMIERSAGKQPAVKTQGGKDIQEKLYEGWHVTDNFGNSAEFPTSGDVLRFFDRVNEATETSASVEPF